VLNAIAGVVTNLVGGSADLNPSTKTVMKDRGDFEAPAAAPAAGAPKTQGTSGGPRGYEGRNVHFGVREHAMAAALTGMAVHGGVVPYGATFLTFSDYMRPSIRLAALSGVHVIYVFTHDSLALGEDGPTHQPIEQLASLRAIPHMTVIRPSDATETVEAWRAALLASGPVALILTRQKLPVLDRSALAPAAGLARGAYVLADAPRPDPDVILIATGSEVSLALDARKMLDSDGIAARVVSMPSWELFAAQSQAYRDSVLPPEVRERVSIEAGTTLGWERHVGREGASIGVDRFGASAPGPVAMREYGFTPSHVVDTVRTVLAGIRARPKASAT
jgi:transketolase